VVRSAAAVALLLVAACGREGPSPTQPPVVTPTATVAPTPTPTPTPVPSGLDIDAVMDHVRALSAEIGLRNSGSNGDVKASMYLADRLRSFGWTAERRAFPLPQGGESWNVVGTPPGFDDTKPYLIVGGHYDSLNGPGANDNATGPAIALEIAHSVAIAPAALPVMFVGFGAEERQPTPTVHHHVGSRWFVSHMSAASKEALVSMINIDMVGIGSTIACPRLATGSREGADRCLRVAKSLGYPAIAKVTPDWSDHGTFLKAGMDASWVWTGEDPCCNHSPRDTFAHVHRDDIARAATVAGAIVRSYSS
jgi:peptidase M28-like protein